MVNLFVVTSETNGRHIEMYQDNTMQGTYLTGTNGSVIGNRGASNTLFFHLVQEVNGRAPLSLPLTR
jgi:hypothetical protein